MKKISAILLSLYCFTQISCQQAGDRIAELKLKSEVEAFNKKGGQVVDAETKMDSMAIKPKLHLYYYYTAVNYTRAQLDTNIIKKSMYPQALTILAGKSELKYYREKGVTFCYYYFDKDGKYLFSFEVTPADYNKKQS